MKRFVLKVSAFAMTVVLLLLALFAVEYYYDADMLYGRNETYYSHCPIKNLNDYQKDPNPNIILGDSRVANLRTFMADFNAAAQGEYTNLGVAGGTMQDELNLFWWCAAQTKLENVYLEVSFYSIQENRSNDETSELFPLVNNPIRYCINRGTISRTIECAKNRGKEKNADNGKSKEETLAAHTKNVYRMCTKGNGYKVKQAYVDGIIEIEQYCRENGIHLYLFAPPYYESVQQEIIDKLSMQESMDAYKQKMLDCTAFRDMEFVSEFAQDADNFADSIHISAESMPRFIGAIVRGQEEFVREIALQE